MVSVVLGKDRLSDTCSSYMSEIKQIRETMEILYLHWSVPLVIEYKTDYYYCYSQ